MKRSTTLKRFSPVVISLMILILITTLVHAEAGSYAALNAGVNYDVKTMAFDSQGNLYAGGYFSKADGITVNQIAKWDGTSWSALGSGVNQQVNDIVVADNGDVYAGGTFTTAGGSPISGIAKWDGSNWTSLGTGINGHVWAMAFDSIGNLYVGGTFTTAGGVSANNIAVWNGAVWNNLGLGVDNTVYDIVIDDSSNVYAGGIFSQAGGQSAGKIAKWDGSSWTTLGSGVDNSIFDMQLGPDGNLYVVGSFPHAGGITVNKIAKWDGSSWSGIGGGFPGFVFVLSIYVKNSNTIYVGGSFPDLKNIVMWDGSSYSTLGDGVDSSVEEILLSPSGELYIGGGFDTSNSVTLNNIARWDNSMPTVSTSSPANGAVLQTASTLKVDFSEDMKADGSTGAANNVVNYMLVEANGDGFQTTSCASGVNAQDTAITINSAVYSNNGGSGPFEATLTVNGGSALTKGNYKLFICGTTSIEDLAGNKINGGLSDETITFDIAPEALPATGFAPGEITVLPVQPVDYSYAPMGDLWLEIPKLDVQTDIVGVPVKDGDWDLTWLGSDAGWLHGTAFPTWSGNSAITAHVTDANGNPGVFAELKQLNWGDRIIVHGWGQEYVYEVREVKKYVDPADSSDVFEHEEYPWLTLITCRGYDPDTGDYNWRLVVRAVQVEVK